MSDAKVPSPPGGWAVAAAIGFNLIPIIGVTFWGWSAFALIFLYWLENVVIGLRTVASMLVSGLVGGTASLPATLFFSGFFSLHYGLFCIGHGLFVVLLFGVGPGAVSHTITFDLFAITRDLFATQTNLVTGFISIALWQTVLFVLFLLRGEAKRTNPLDLMGAPYPRIMILHIAIIGGGFLLMALNQPLAGLIALALLKMAFDIAQVFDKPKPAAEGEGGPD